MSGRAEIGDEELSAYLDGEFDAARQDEIARLIQSDPALAERVAAMQSDMRFLRELYAPIVAQPLPPSWRARIESHGRGRTIRVYGSIAAMAATIVLAAICLPLVMRFWPSPQGPDIIADALAAQSGSVAPQASLATAARDVASSVISQALAMRLKAPDLSRMGYSLEAVKIYAGTRGNQPVELVYRNAQNDAFSLYLHRPVGAPRFDQFKRGGERVCIWQDDVLGTVMVGEMSAPEMQRLASLSYTGLTL
jgi:anti-sigma factor RsiW